MAPQKHRFSRRFLTLLIFVTCVAIILLSRLDEPEDQQRPVPVDSTQPSANQP